MGQKTMIRKFVNPEIVYGVGASKLVGQYTTIYNAKRVMVVSDPGVEAAGWTEQVMTGVRDAGVEAVLFVDVSSNPRDYEVMKGADLYRARQCDAIVVVGGGSPIDCAKGIGIVVSNNCHILECEGVDRVAFPMPPLFCIPTTAGSSADVSQFAIINNTQQHVKVAIISKSTVPDVTLIDPATTCTMSPYLTACTGMDALVHAIEAYVSKAASPLTDLHALQAVRLVGTHLLTAIREPDNMTARDGMMLASLEAGLAFSNASLGAVHAMAHSLGGAYDLPHGECNALLLEHVIRFNFEAAISRYVDIAAAFTRAPQSLSEMGACDRLVAAIHELRYAAGITKILGETGLTPASIPDLASKAMRDACMVTNPRRPTQQDIEEIYGNAL